MPAYLELESEQVGYKNSDAPLVYMDGELQPLMTCTIIEDVTGIAPSRALLRLGATGVSATGPITLNRYVWPWGPGTQVVVTLDAGNVLFRGMLVRRRDRGQKDDIIWEAACDKWLLAQIPVYGCLVRDPASGDVKFVNGYTPRMNPKGYWNCVPGLVAGKLVPVFSDKADIGVVYQSPVATFEDELVNGKRTAWTPRRALLYWQTIANLGPGDVPGVASDTWRSIKNSTRLKFLEAALNLISRDATDTFDPLDRKMPDTEFRGMKLLAAIQRTLDVAGTHGFKLEYGDEESYVTFYPRGVNGATTQVEQTLDLHLTRGGNADDLNTVYDFDLDEDTSEVAESVLVHGARIHTEAPVDTVALTLRWAATDAELTSYLQIIDGQDSGGIRYAYYPSKQGSTENNTLADGTTVNGIVKPLAYARSAEAVDLANQCFPHVINAFMLNSVQLRTDGFMEGVASEYADLDTYPVIGTDSRQILPEQLQYYVTQTERLLARYPVRVQLKNTNGDWHDVDARVRADDRGFIWVEGLPLDGSETSLFDGALINHQTAAPLTIVRKGVRLNVAFPLDHRVTGYAKIDAGTSCFDEKLFIELGGPPLAYIDSPEAYREEHQVESEPTPFLEHIAETDISNATQSTVSGALLRYLPPGSEKTHAEHAAQRKLFATRWVPKKSCWSLVGIRPDFKTGQWIAKVSVHGGSTDDRDFDINAPVESVVHDFRNQTTIVGGLISLAPAAIRTPDNTGQEQGAPFSAAIMAEIRKTSGASDSIASVAPPMPPEDVAAQPAFMQGHGGADRGIDGPPPASSGADRGIDGPAPPMRNDWDKRWQGDF
jgi:hypothetical protein